VKAEYHGPNIISLNGAIWPAGGSSCPSKFCPLGSYPYFFAVIQECPLAPCKQSIKSKKIFTLCREIWIFHLRKCDTYCTKCLLCSGQGKLKSVWQWLFTSEITEINRPQCKLMHATI